MALDVAMLQLLNACYPFWYLLMFVRKLWVLNITWRCLGTRQRDKTAFAKLICGHASGHVYAAKICINSFNDDWRRGANRVCTRIHQDYWFITGCDGKTLQWVGAQSADEPRSLSAVKVKPHSALVRVKEWLLKIIIKQFFSFRRLAPIPVPYNNPVRSMSHHLYWAWTRTYLQPRITMDRYWNLEAVYTGS